MNFADENSVKFSNILFDVTEEVVICEHKDEGIGEMESERLLFRVGMFISRYIRVF